jgi:hypothetical protein
VNPVASWTGSQADALRQALRMSNEAFAAHLGVAVRTVAYWRARPDVVPVPSMQEILDTALARASAPARELFTTILAGPRDSAQRSPGGEPGDDLTALAGWLTATNTTDDAIDQADQTTAALADLHTQRPAGRLLADVLRPHKGTQELLHSGRQHLRQTRDLIRIDGMSLAHASVLLGDLGRDHDASRYGRAALLCLQEADASEAPAWYALAKTPRWRHDYATAADLASRGFHEGPVTPMSVQLASYEANAAALLGDTARAAAALNRADMLADVMTACESSSSPWAFPTQRQAIFRLSVLLRTSDPDGALRAAAEAETAWASGEPQIPGTWAQVRIGAAIAQLQRAQLDAAQAEVAPVLAMPADLRIATVTGWLADLDSQLAVSKHHDSVLVTGMRRQIRAFTAAALPSDAREAG